MLSVDPSSLVVSALAFSARGVCAISKLAKSNMILPMARRCNVNSMQVTLLPKGLLRKRAARIHDTLRRQNLVAMKGFV